MSINYQSINYFIALLGSYRTLVIVSIISLLLVFYIYTQKLSDALGHPELVSGYVMFGIILTLMCFRLRKKLAVISLFRASSWRNVHIILGLSCVVIYFIHTKTLWPKGTYEQILVVLFYLNVLSGVLGIYLQYFFPQRLTDSGIEIIFERIPAEIAEVRDEVESIIINCSSDTKSITLGRHYIETLDWFFIKPRFLLNHIRGGKKSEHWIVNQFSSVKQYLKSTELQYLEKLFELAHYKSKVDFHYSLQMCLKFWRFIHIPIAGALVMISLWHLVLINIYST